MAHYFKSEFFFTFGADNYFVDVRKHQKVFHNSQRNLCVCWGGGHQVVRTLTF